MTSSDQERIPSEQGRYHDYYEAFASAVASGGDAPVSADQGVATLAVLDAARTSAAEKRTVDILQI